MTEIVREAPASVAKGGARRPAAMQWVPVLLIAGLVGVGALVSMRGEGAGRGQQSLAAQAQATAAAQTLVEQQASATATAAAGGAAADQCSCESR